MTFPAEVSNADNAESEFLIELRNQFDREEDLRKTLDKKASTMITISSTIFTILSGIGTFMINHIPIDKSMPNPLFFPLFLVTSLILIGGVILAIISISYFVRTYATRRYSYPMGVEYFFRNDGKSHEEKINQFRDSSKREFIEHMIKEYINSINKNGTSNVERGKLIKNGYGYLIKSVIAFGFTLVLVIIYSIIYYFSTNNFHLL
jgi:hypothetical protein